MEKRPSVTDMSRRVAKFHDDGVKTRGEERYLQRVEQIARWRAEHERNEAAEENLAALSKFSYEPVDYTSLLVITPWQQPPKTDYSYLVTEAIKAQEEKYFLPLAIRGALIFLLLIVFVVLPNALTGWVMLTIGVAVLLSIYYTVMEKKKNLLKAKKEAEEEIEQLEQQEAQNFAKAKAAHEEKEQKRVESIERLLTGDDGAVMLRLNETLPKLGLPFPVEVTIELYDGVPYIKVWLPLKNIVPTRRSSLLMGGAIHYVEKEMREINKQYMELCAGLFVTLLVTIYDNIPSFTIGYAAAISREGLEDSYFISLEVNRDKLMTMCTASSGIQALKLGEAVFENDTALNYLPIEAQYPKEWDDFDKKKVKSITIKIFK